MKKFFQMHKDEFKGTLLYINLLIFFFIIYCFYMLFQYGVSSLYITCMVIGVFCYLLARVLLVSKNTKTILQCFWIIFLVYGASLIYLSDSWFFRIIIGCITAAFYVLVWCVLNNQPLFSRANFKLKDEKNILHILSSKPPEEIW